jgi:hypothetical protein
LTIQAPPLRQSRDTFGGKKLSRSESQDEAEEQMWEEEEEEEEEDRDERQ